MFNVHRNRCLFIKSWFKAYMKVELNSTWPAVAGGNTLRGGDKGQILQEMIKVVNKHNDRERFPALAQSKTRNMWSNVKVSKARLYH